MNWQWPRTNENGFEAWYVIAWRALWYPLYLAVIGTGWIVVTLMYGRKEGLSWVHKAT